MNIFSCIDNNNIEKIFILFYSCYKNCKNKDHLKFYILTENPIDSSMKIPEFLKDILTIRPLDKEYLKKTEWMDMINTFSEIFYHSGHSANNIMNFSRFFIFHIFPEVDRFIYLDWDMIVNEDILKLDEFYNSDKLIAAKSDKIDFKTILGNIGYLNKDQYFYYDYLTNVNIFVARPHLRNLVKSTVDKFNKIFLHITDKKNVASKPSFNAGFYIVSKNHFDEQNLLNIIKKLIEIQRNKKTFRFGTQIIMNLIAIDENILIDSKWNNKPTFDSNNYIDHWAGMAKPWIIKDPKWIKYYNEYKEIN